MRGREDAGILSIILEIPLLIESLYYLLLIYALIISKVYNYKNK